MITESEMKAYTVDIPNDIQAAQRASGCASATLLELPTMTRQPVLHIDGTPDSGYVIRILQAYRENCNVLWSSTPPSPLWEQMNKDQAARAALLDKAIATLVSSNVRLNDGENPNQTTRP